MDKLIGLGMGIPYPWPSLVVNYYLAETMGKGYNEGSL